jgi:Zn-dependent protease with chaperone function
VLVAAAAEREAEVAAAIAANRRRARLLLGVAGGVPAVVLGVIGGLAAGPVVAVAVAVVVLVGLTWAVSATATRIAVSVVGGRPVAPDELPGLANVVDGLCATLGVPAPRLLLVDDAVPNACTLGRRPGDAVLVVTTGLLGRLDLIETEGVVAHELVHVKLHDTAVSSLAVTVLLPLTRITGRSQTLHTAVGRGREFRADQDGVAAVRYPPGLASALGSMIDGPYPAAGSVFTGWRWAATRWIWIDPMVGQRSVTTVGDLDTTSVRRDALVER